MLVCVAAFFQALFGFFGFFLKSCGVVVVACVYASLCVCVGWGVVVVVVVVVGGGVVVVVVVVVVMCMLCCVFSWVIFFSVVVVVVFL